MKTAPNPYEELAAELLKISKDVCIITATQVRGTGVKKTPVYIDLGFVPIDYIDRLPKE